MYKGLSILIIILSLLSNSFGQKNAKYGEALDDGSGTLASEIVKLTNVGAENERKKRALEPFAVGFFGWKVLAFSRLGIGTYEASHIDVSRLILNVYDDELNATILVIKKRPKTLTEWAEVTPAEKKKIQEFVVQKKGGKYMGLSGLSSRKLENKDEVASWKYLLGAGLGELSAHVIMWFRFPNYPKYDGYIAEYLNNLDDDIKNAPVGTSAVLLNNLKKLKAYGAKKNYTVAEREQIANALEKTLTSTITIADSKLFANTQNNSNSSGLVPDLSGIAPKTNNKPAVNTTKPKSSTRPKSNTTPSYRTATPKTTGAKNFADGKIFASKGMYKRAVYEFTQALKFEPQNGLIYFHRAMAYNALNELDKAIYDYNTVIMLKTSLFEAYYNRGNLHLKKKLYSSAIADYDRSIAIKANDYKRFYGRGLAQYYLMNNAKAYADFSKVIQLNPNYSDAYKMRALVSCRQNLPISAIRDQEKAISLGAQIEKGCK